MKEKFFKVLQVIGAVLSVFTLGWLFSKRDAKQKSKITQLEIENEIQVSNSKIDNSDTDELIDNANDRFS